jgi:sugar fermentation stimulation protein A
VPEALAAGLIPELAGYPEVRSEVPYGKNSRIDLLLSAPGLPQGPNLPQGMARPTCYVEIKNVHLKRDPRLHAGPAEFPDAVTARGLKHLVELEAEVARGNRAVMLYVVQRGDCDSFRIAGDIDPAYEAGLRAALGAGVEAICYSCRMTVDAIEWDRQLPIELGPIDMAPTSRPARSKRR